MRTKILGILTPLCMTVLLSGCNGGGPSAAAANVAGNNEGAPSFSSAASTSYSTESSQDETSYSTLAARQTGYSTGTSSSEESLSLDSGDSSGDASAAGASEKDRAACYAIQAKLKVALDTYNARKGMRIQRLETDLYPELIEEGLLSEKPEDPGRGPGTAFHFHITPNSTDCLTHGEAPASASAARAAADKCTFVRAQIQNALRRYNSDRNMRVDDLSGSTFEALVSGGYLKTIPDDPGCGPASSSHFQVRNGKVSCSKHWEGAS